MNRVCPYEKIFCKNKCYCEKCAFTLNILDHMKSDYFNLVFNNYNYCYSP